MKHFERILSFTVIFGCAFCVAMNPTKSSAQGLVIRSDTSSITDTSAILEVQSASKGFLIPRLTNTQRDSINNPAEGLQIFNTTTGCLEFFNGTAWIELCGCTSAPAATITSPSQQFSVSQTTTIAIAASAPIHAAGYWSASPNGTFDDATDSTTNFTGTAGLRYTLTWRTFNNCGAGIDTREILILDIPPSTTFVDQATGNDTAAGTYSQPVKTIMAGIQKAVTSSHSQVLVCEGIYNEQVVLASGINLNGGYEYSTLEKDPVRNEAIITASDDPVSGINITGSMIFDGFSISATAGLASTYGISLTGCQNIVIRNCKILAADGANGANGTDGTTGISGSDGSNGGSGCKNGGTAGGCGTCSQPTVGSGGSVPSASHGGNGGSPGLGMIPGTAGAAGLPSGSGGSGGAGGAAGGCADAQPGSDGAQGLDGVNGTGGSNFGTGTTILQLLWWCRWRWRSRRTRWEWRRWRVRWSWFFRYLAL